MREILSLLSHVEIYIVIGLVVFNIFLLILVIILFKAVRISQKKYRKFMKGADNKNIEQILTNIIDQTDIVNKNNEEVKSQLLMLNEKFDTCIQKFAMVRYKAFEDVGGDLSYSVALLDYNNSGVLLTGIYGRNESTSYAKPIDKGISRYDLSEEEQQALNDAINKN
ncbi:MAG: DUF4446 family protein [Bacillota bacterium]|nr:DUF4446 family protein [Bacillota bacterium]